MASKIGIIDYQMGNLRSVQKAFEKNGFAAEIFSDPNQMATFDKVVLPGVGAFRDAISEIKQRGFAGPIQEWIAADKPFLGICLGLQMLFEKSFEDGEYDGLGIIQGDVVKFDLPKEFKVPHMGWNQIQRSSWFHTFPSIKNETHFYFVHSYYVRPNDQSLVALTANYGTDFCAAISRGNLFASQFHPEKSQQSGLSLLKHFAEGTNSAATP